MRITTLAEEPGLGEDIRRFINRCLWRDFVTKSVFEVLTRKDPNYDPRYAFIAVENGSVEAVAIGVRRVKEPASMVEAHKPAAWAKILAAATGNIEPLNEALEALEDAVRGEGRRQLRVSDYASWYLIPGVDVEYDHIYRLLVNRGYRRGGEAVNYEVDLSRFYTPGRVAEMTRRLVSEGVDIVEVEWSEELGKWIEERFGPFWRIEARMAFEAQEGGILIASKGGEIMGFSVYGALRPDFFGPIGVDPNIRGKGIGTVLLFETLHRMKENGVRIVTIPWTSHLGFYAQVPGIIGIRYFLLMIKEL